MGVFSQKAPPQYFSFAHREHRGFTEKFYQTLIFFVNPL